MKLKTPIIIDNIISQNYMNKIEKSCIESSWAYSNNITYGENYDKLQDGFSLRFDENCFQYALVQYLIFKSCEKINFKIDEIFSVRKRLTYSSEKKYNIPYQPHVDFEYNHLVLLYYVNNSDGDTFVYKEKYNKKNINIVDKKYSLLKQIEFKKGRIVIFDGKNYHASSLSSFNPRIVLNINLKGKFKKNK